MKAIFAALICLGATHASAQVADRALDQTPAAPEATATPMPEDYRSPSELKKLPIEQLIDVEITSAARRPELLSRASSAIDVITADDIRRAGVTNLPDAFRLATEMQVAQIDGHTWAITTRGFNISTANKLQVLLDGRTLYSPLFSGVFWDVQQVFLPDLEQIEIIRGPGATLWGANAVNGVINIRTKSAFETQGVMIYGGGGNEERAFGGIRYGGTIGANTSFRVYAMHQSRDDLTLSGGGDASDDYHITQGGFRIDSKVHPDDTATLQGDFYGGNFGLINSADGEVEGENILGRWTHDFGHDSSLALQAYFDRTHRFIPNVFEETRETYDLELQHRFRLAQHDIVYGANYRVSHDDIGNIGPVVAFLPNADTQHLVSGYLQDEWHIVPDLFSITAGSKVEYNTFSGFEIQPTARFTWTPAKEQTLWGAVSRAVRTPTRIDQDVVVPNPSTGIPAVLSGTSGFDSEVLVAYELGYRVKPIDRLSFDLALFYNDYDSLRSQETQPDGSILLKNLGEATSYGGSLAAKWRVADWWELDGSVSLLQLDFHGDGSSNDHTGGIGEANDPNASFIVHSAIDLPRNVQFDSYLRFVDELPNPSTPSYLELDLRLSWSPLQNLELAIVGRNLLHESHPEFAGGSAPTREIPRSVYGTVRWNF
ncbi:MAG: TonB-dependent receptor [Chthoniobacterales bacterium]